LLPDFAANPAEVAAFWQYRKGEQIALQGVQRALSVALRGRLETDCAQDRNAVL
jgi:hypothetical protein